MLREAAERTGDAVGDGTTTATILAHAIFAEGLRNVVAGASAVDVKRGLDRGLRVAVDALKALSPPVTSRREKAQIATISAHNDSTIGEQVADAVEKVGTESDLVEAGIIDPTKVVRVALENAVSVASVLLLTEATLTEAPEPKKEAAAEPLG